MHARVDAATPPTANRRSSALKSLLLSLVLGAVTAATFAWLIPGLLLYFDRVMPPRAYGPPGAGPSRNHWWADDAPPLPPRGGVYTIDRSFLFDSIDFRRILFVGVLSEKEYYRANAPPSWAAVISLDMREGFEEVVTIHQGWPLRCIRGEVWHSWRPADPPPITFSLSLPGMAPATPGPLPLPYALRSVHALRRAGRDPVLIPTRVAWAGFAANTAMFGAAWLLLLAAPRRMIRFVRRKRKRCPACGYDLSATALGARCPECGEEKASDRASGPITQ